MGFVQGLTKAGLLGEVSIDFAKYAETTKPFSASLPLHNSNSAVLHVSFSISISVSVLICSKMLVFKFLVLYRFGYRGFRKMLLRGIYIYI